MLGSVLTLEGEMIFSSLLHTHKFRLKVVVNFSSNIACMRVGIFQLCKSVSFHVGGIVNLSTGLRIEHFGIEL